MCYCILCPFGKEGLLGLGQGVLDKLIIHLLVMLGWQLCGIGLGLCGKVPVFIFAH